MIKKTAELCLCMKIMGQAFFMEFENSSHETCSGIEFLHIKESNSENHKHLLITTYNNTREITVC